MAIRQQPLEYDPFSAPIPGQSLTETPGLRPYEKPAMSSDPQQVIDALIDSIEEPETEQRIVDMLEVGVSAETITEALLNKCFTEGLCTPDVAELVKPHIFMKVVEIGVDNNMDDMELFNEAEENDETSMSPEQKLSLMRQTNPSKFNSIWQGDMQDDPIEDTMSEDEVFALGSGAPTDEGSFLDMQPSEYEDVQEEELV